MVIMSDVINVYIGMGRMEGEGDWPYLYPKPNILFKELRDKRNSEGYGDNFLFCPAVTDKFKKTLVFENAMPSKYEYNFKNGQKIIDPISETYLAAESVRDPSITTGPTIKFGMNYIFFADQPLDASFTPPYFHKPGYSKHGVVMPGEYNIGKWFRPYIFEVQMWDMAGEFEIGEEPIFYVEFRTDKKIKFNYFNVTPALYHYAVSSIQVTSLFGKGQTLAERYLRFAKVGMREKILTEIKKNLIE